MIQTVLYSKYISWREVAAEGVKGLMCPTRRCCTPLTNTSQLVVHCGCALWLCAVAISWPLTCPVRLGNCNPTVAPDSQLLEANWQHPLLPQPTKALLCQGKPTQLPAAVTYRLTDVAEIQRPRGARQFHLVANTTAQSQLHCCTNPPAFRQTMPIICPVKAACYQYHDPAKNPFVQSKPPRTHLY